MSCAADWVGAGILAEQAGGVRVRVGEAHTDGPAAGVETAADLRCHRLPVGCRGQSPEVHRNVCAAFLHAGSRKRAHRESIARFECFHLHGLAALRQGSFANAASDLTAAVFAATTSSAFAALAATLATAALGKASIRASLDD